MRKKKLVIISVILSVIAVMIVLASTVFMLKSVTVDIVSENNEVVAEKDADAIIKKAKFNYGGNVLFMNFSKQIARIESAFPYVKVEKIERKFPNKAILHISERTPAAYTTTGEFVYILDKELKVLDCLYASDFNAGNENLPASALNVPKIDLEIERGTSAGQIVNNQIVKLVVQSIILGLETSDTEIAITDLSSITIENESSNFQLLIGFDNSEMKLLIKGSNDLVDKVKVGIGAFDTHIKSHPDATGVLAQKNANEIVFTATNE